MITTLSIEFITSDILIPSILYGLLIGGTIFFLGLGINLCLKLFNS